MAFFSDEERTSYTYLFIPFLCILFAVFCVVYLLFTGWGHFGTVLQDARFWNALSHNIVWMIWAVIVPIGLGLLLAILLSKNLKGEKIWKGIIYFPALLSGAVVGLAWVWFYHSRYGVLNSVLEGLNLKSAINPEGYWLGAADYTIPFLVIISVAIFAISITLITFAFHPKISQRGLIIAIGGVGIVLPTFLFWNISTPLLSTLLASTWPAVAISMIIFLATMRAIPQRILESAKVDCASGLQTLRHVILPHLRPSFTILIVLSAISSMKVFSMVFALTGSGAAGGATDVLALRIWTLLRESPGQASAIGFLGIIVTTVPIAIYLLIMRKKEESE